jgi:hypothetical protein
MPLMQLNNTGAGSAFSGLSATGDAAMFESMNGRSLMARITNAASILAAIEARHDGLGMAVFASTTNAASTNPAIGASSVGTGPALGVSNAGGGNNPGQDGVLAATISTHRRAAAVHARGNGASGPGVPQAAALHLDSGAINVSGILRQRPAGTIPVPNNWQIMVDCDAAGHRHTIGWWVDVPLQNDLIMLGNMNQSDSIILATVETTFPNPFWQVPDISYYVQVHSKTPGNCWFRITRMGELDPDPMNCPPPSEQNVVHYQIINPTP